MKIMAIADAASPALWEHYNDNKLYDTDLIVSCGDLDPRYLSFLVTCVNVPLLYVHGNHDECYDDIPPDGCICIDDRVYVHNGIRFLGLGGCFPYNKGKYMYTEAQMKRRIRRVSRQIRKYGGLDVLVTHAPVRGIGDGEDLPHRGYQAFIPLLEKCRPPYMLHGHVHMQYDYTLKRENEYQDTKIINAYEKYFLEIQDGGAV
ncbi:MAG: metallophosphoesterase family protein [Lachnospiraceae bacterium]|nr:metallophosphoesterase family protein [Lachnospiraceae bacterium]